MLHGHLGSIIVPYWLHYCVDELKVRGPSARETDSRLTFLFWIIISWVSAGHHRNTDLLSIMIYVLFMIERPIYFILVKQHPVTWRISYNTYRHAWLQSAVYTVYQYYKNAPDPVNSGSLNLQNSRRKLHKLLFYYSYSAILELNFSFNFTVNNW